MSSTPLSAQSPAKRDSRLATRDLLDISVTERAQFRSCRRRWFLETVRNLEPKSPTWAFKFGTCMHSALETFYLGGDTDAAHDAFEEAFNGVMKELESGTDRDEWQEHHDLGHGMLDNYFAYDKVYPNKLGKVLAVEGKTIEGNKLPDKMPPGYPESARVEVSPSGRLLVPIVDPETKEPLPGSPCLTAQIDLLTLRKTPRLGLWVIDHKNLAQGPADRGLDFDDQVTGYAYAVWRWKAQLVRGVLYNVLIKQLPKEPRYNKTAKHGSHLSTAKDQLTTADLYRAALREEGLMRNGKVSSDPHAECLAGLLARGWEPFFRRLEAPRNEHQILQFEENLFKEYADMGEAVDDDNLYPNPSIRNCPCTVGPICLAMMEGSDPEYVIEEQYQEAEDRKA